MKSKQFVLACIPIVVFCLLYHYSRHRIRDTKRDGPVPRDEPWGEPTDQQTVRMCENHERLEALKEYCKKRNHAANLNHLTLRKRVHRFLVDDVNKVLFCLHAKVGCSTWKTIIVNNTSHRPIPPDEDLHIHSELLQYNVSLLDDYKFSDEDILHRLHDYYKVMVVRHPHERLNSFFYEKFLRDDNEVFRRTMGFQIMNTYHRDLPREVRKAGRISFSDITHWMQDGGIDPHFDGPYMKKCDPCFVQYDYIAKLESHDRDAAYVINNKLKGRGLDTSINVQEKLARNPLLLGTGKHIGIFKNLTDEQKLFMHDRLTPDLEMFGYTFNETTLQAKCIYKDKQCC